MGYKGVVFDLDGTIYLGDRLIQGADRVVRRLRQAGVSVVFLSNKPIESRLDHARKLTGLGIPTDEAEVISSAHVSAEYLGRTMPGARVYVIGEGLLVRELKDNGLKMATRPDETDLVLLSLDRGLSYEKIHFAYHAACSGARVMATNPDVVCAVGSLRNPLRRRKREWSGLQ